jgi:SAM-dependent methyltransferase
MLDNVQLFVAREYCVACQSGDLERLSSGRFGEEPLRSFIGADPIAADPMKVLENETWDFRQCRQCGQKQHYLVPSAFLDELCFSEWQNAETIRAFEAEQGMNNPAVEHVQHILRLQRLGVKRLLDFGCGFAKFLEMCRLFNLDAVGVDKSHGRRSGADLEVFSDLSEVQGSFDAITMFEVLEHLYEPMDIVIALKARLNPGGVMIVEVPDTSGVTRIDSLASYRAIHPLEHVNAFTPEALVAFMARAGFRPITKQPAFVTTSLKRVAKDVAKAKLKSPGTMRYFALA